MEQEKKNRTAAKNPNGKLPQKKDSVTVKVDWRKKYYDLLSDTKKRLYEKDRYIAQVEDECEAKTDNKDVIINALQNDIAVLKRKLESAEKRIATYNRWGLFFRLFGKKS